MRDFLFILLFTLPTVLLAQKHKVGLSVSAGVSNQTSSGFIENINNSLPTTTPNHPPKFLNPPVKEEYAFAAKVSLVYEYTIRENLAFFGGLNFSKSGFQITEEKLLFRSQYLPSRGYVNPPLESYLAVSYSFDYYQLGIPMGINYFVKCNKVRFLVGAGVSANYLVAVKSTTIMHERRQDVTQNKTETSSFNKVSVAALLNFGAEIPLKNNFSLRVFSGSQYTVTNFADKDKDYNIHPYLTSLGVSILKSL